MIKVSIITVSDKGSRGERMDTSGPGIRKALDKKTYSVKNIVIIPDDKKIIIKELKKFIKNNFYNQVQELYKKKASVAELTQLLGRARAKLGIFEGDLEEGELEIGQVAGLIHNILPAGDIVNEIISEYLEAKKTAQYF